MKDTHTVLLEILAEYIAARKLFPPMASAHEGYAILLEEVDELWTEVKGNKRDMDTYLKAIRGEAVQVAAMAFSLILEVCDAVDRGIDE